MPRILPFVGLTFDTAVSGSLERVTTPPYDVISDEERLDLMRASPYSVVHLDLADPDPAEAAATAGRTEPYAAAAALLSDWEAKGAIRRGSEARYYAYEMHGCMPDRLCIGMGRRTEQPVTVRGLICAMSLEGAGGTVTPHEAVREGPVRERLALLRAMSTHLSPVYAQLHSDQHGLGEGLDDLVRTIASTPTRFEVLDEQGVRHRMWPVNVDGMHGAHVDSLEHERVLIADGHHRYEAALRYAALRRSVDGPGPWETVMTLVVSSASGGPPVLPLHRVQLAGRPPAPRGEAVAGLEAAASALSDDAVTVATITRGAAGEVEYRVRRLDGEPPTVRALHDELLDELAPAGSLHYTPEADHADAAVRHGDAVAAYLLPPTTPGRIGGVVGRGERLPAKSTYFWPKPRTGMVMMPLGPVPPPRGSQRERPPPPANLAEDRTGRAS